MASNPWWDALHGKIHTFLTRSFQAIPQYHGLILGYLTEPPGPGLGSNLGPFETGWAASPSKVSSHCIFIGDKVK